MPRFSHKYRQNYIAGRSKIRSGSRIFRYPANWRVSHPEQVRQRTIRAQRWREDENIRQTLSPAIVATPQSWGYHIGQRRGGGVCLVIATPQIWGYHIFWFLRFVPLVLSLPRKSGGITSGSLHFNSYHELSLPRKSGGITFPRTVSTSCNWLSLPRKSGGITLRCSSAVPFVIATPQIWGYHIRIRVIRAVELVIATPQIWGYHIWR